jgi:hypothetical protein
MALFNKNNPFSMYLCIVTVLLIFNITHIYGQELNPNTSIQYMIDDKINGGLQYLKATQIRRLHADSNFHGEWPSEMQLRTRFILLGKKKPYTDANCFTVASIHNELAQICLQDSIINYSLLSTLGAAFTATLRYKNGNAFNFWNLLPANTILKKGRILANQPLVRRPSTFQLKGRFMNNAANIAEDADDTGLAFAAIFLHNKICAINKSSDSIPINTSIIKSLFENHRDTNRHNRHWYNYINNKEKNTGAYLTWLGEEFSFKKYSPWKAFLHYSFFFTKWSSCFPKAYTPYIPYGANDLDGVVNANVLSTLGMLQAIDAKGYFNAIQFVEKKCKQKKYTQVGVYYPNSYAFPYAISKAFMNNKSALKNASQYVVDNLIINQNEDGSWSSRKIVNNKDVLQSTIYATNALLNFGEFKNRNTTDAIEKGIHYILKNSIVNINGTHWQGGVFFSGGPVVRNTLFWKSDAYTTALALTALVHYKWMKASL